MAYSALAVANAFIERAKEGKLPDLTPMKLQKLLFYVQSWYLKQRGSPLFDDNFARWTHGPVIPSIYHEFKGYGSGVIQAPGSTVVPRPSSSNPFAYEVVVPEINRNDQDAIGFIDEVIRVYGQLSGWQLSQMTHQAGTAWQISGAPDGGPIPLNVMAEHIHPGNR
ncbi:Panacea domain-containing protein [Pseudomonas sp.]|uniref:Panacea domain-containing protein n=1 Tax=Pseudomonas sp. TaxID=306 RepID=UPI003982B082